MCAWHARTAALEFVGLAEADRRPHVMVDGRARATSALTLSHWASSPSPRRYWRDTSTEMCFAYRSRRRRLLADAVTCDHLDEDGLCSLAVFVDPVGAFERRERLEALAVAGDFGVVRDEHAATISFVAGALLDRDRSPFSAGDPDDWFERGYRESLKVLFEAIDHVERFRSSYELELSRYRASLRILQEAGAILEEHGDLGLCVISLGQQDTKASASPLSHVEVPIHPAVLHSATRCPRILLLHGARYWYWDRYETWVRFISHPLLKRRSLEIAAAELDTLDNDSSWHADPPGALVPVLMSENDSALSLGQVLEVLTRAFAGPVAWDPFDPKGAMQRVTRDES